MVGSEVDATERSGAARPGMALFAISLGFGVVQLDVSIVNVAIAPIGSELGGSVTSLQWVVGAYTVAFAALILSSGALGDRIGARRVFVAGFALFTAASAACGLAPSIGVLVAARTIQGVGAALLVPCSLALINHSYVGAVARARAVGVWAAAASSALAAGPLIGGLLIAALSWRAIFFVNLPIGLLGIVLVLRYTTETTRTAARSVDVVGQVLGIATLVLFAAAMVEAGHRGFGDGLIVLGFVLAVLGAVAFVVVERRRADPMLPVSLFASRTVATTTVFGLVINAAFYGLIFVLGLYFPTVLGFSALNTGLAFAPTTIAVLMANLTTGRLFAAVDTRFVLVGGTLLMAAGFVGMWVVELLMGPRTSFAALVAPLIAVGFALGAVIPAITAALLGSVARERSGVASGLLNTARQTGSVVGVALFGSLAVGDTRVGLLVVLPVAAVLALLAAPLARLVREPT